MKITNDLATLLNRELEGKAVLGVECQKKAVFDEAVLKVDLGEGKTAVLRFDSYEVINQ